MRSAPLQPWWRTHPRAKVGVILVGVATVASVLPLRFVGPGLPRQPWMFLGALLLGILTVGILAVARRPSHRPMLRVVCATAGLVASGFMLAQALAQVVLARFEGFGDPTVASDVETILRSVALMESIVGVTLGLAFLTLRRSVGGGQCVRAGRWTVLGVVLFPVALFILDPLLLMLIYAVD